MGVHVSVRSYRRPDQPQPVYPRVVDVTVAKWAPVWQHEALLSRTNDCRRVDVRGNEWAPDDGWVPKAVDTVVRTWAPAFSAELDGKRTPDPVRRLEVRGTEWFPDDGWIPRVVDTTVSKWAPVFQHELRAERTGSRAVLDVRVLDWSGPPAWIFGVLTPTATVAQQWPAILEGLGLSYRSGDKPALDVRRYDWFPNDGWVPRVVDSTVSRWAPVFDAEVGLRTPDRASVDVRTAEWSAWGWLPLVAVAPTVSRWAPIFDAERSTRTADGPRLDVRAFEWSPELGWIVSALTPSASIAQQWPAILQALGLSYRSPDRAALDVRAAEWAPGFAWVARVVDTTVQTWLPAITSALRAERSAGRLALDVRGYDWSSLAWIVSNLPPALSFAQQWPAILQAIGLSYRMADRAVLDVRADLWTPEQGWIPKVVDSALARVAPVFSAELQTFRSSDRRRLDVRSYEWSPEFGWAFRVGDTVVSRWAPIWNAEIGLWTPSRPVLDVRPGTDRPEWATWAAFLALGTQAVPPVGRTVAQDRQLRTVATATAVYEALVVADAPGGYWRLDEPAGPTVVDSSGHGHHGLYDGPIVYGQRGLIADGDAAIVVDGTLFPSPMLCASIDLPALTDTFSVEIWFTLSAFAVNDAVTVFSGNDRTLAISPTPVQLVRFWIFSDGQAFVNTAGNSQLVLGTLIHVGVRHHVVVVRSPSGHQVYLNGVLEQSDALPSSAPNDFIQLGYVITNFTVGSSFDLDQLAFNGTLDEFAVYQAALTPAQVALHYAAGVAPSTGTRAVRALRGSRPPV